MPFRERRLPRLVITDTVLPHISAWMAGHVRSWPGPKHQQGTGPVEAGAQCRFLSHGSAGRHLRHEGPAPLRPQPKSAAASFTPAAALRSLLWSFVLGLVSQVAGGGVCLPYDSLVSLVCCVKQTPSRMFLRHLCTPLSHTHVISEVHCVTSTMGFPG